ncbi:hypothetical protein ABFO59_05180 [Acinetobacter radioresistens]|uniref:hypothetical protein n=1 Tax=Acinetobacter radioresistens TaxID=40216 RepID=UPI0032142F23
MTNLEKQKIRYAYNGKPQQWQWGFKSGWNARQSEIDELKAQLCKAHERLELIQEEFVETETYLKEQIEQKNSKITSFEYLVEQDKIHIQSQQSRVVDLKAQLECCRKEGEKIDSLVESFISHTEQFGFESDEAQTALGVLRRTLQGYKCVNVVFIAKSPILSSEEEKELKNAMQRAVVIKSFPDLYWVKNNE